MMHPDVRLRLIQAGIPQKDKWRPELRDRHLATYLRLSHSPNDRGQQPSFSHLIWPETERHFFSPGTRCEEIPSLAACRKAQY